MMAKAKISSHKKTDQKPKNKAEAPSRVTITYDLFDLPTAQHKAGLAGLLLQIESMKNRKLSAPTYKWDDEYPRTKMRVEFTEETTAALFDDLYDADLIDGQPREKPFTKGKGESKHIVPPIRRVLMIKTDKKGKETTIEGYIYRELTPALRTLRHFLPNNGDWVKLWRDLIWQIIREGRKKAPYISRAAKKGKMPDSEASAISDSKEADSDEKVNSKADGSSWSDIVKIAAAQIAGSSAVGRLSGALLLGAMADNAETVPLFSRIEHSLLLHFWPLAMLVFVPRFIDKDGESYIGRRNSNDKDPHFSIVIPDVADLRSFIQDYRRLLATLETDMAGFRPRESVIDIPAEGGFAFIEHLAKLVPQQAAGTDISYSISAVEYYHVTKAGNNVKFLSTGRIAFSPHIAERYHSIAKSANNPLFRRCLIIALLDDLPWFQPFGKLFAEWPHEFFIHNATSPKNWTFWIDAWNHLKEDEYSMRSNSQESPPDEDKVLASIVNHFIRRYLDERLKNDGYDFAAYRKAKNTPPDAAEARQKLAGRLFLEFRPRHEQAFISHFSNTFFRVGQYFGKDDDFAMIASKVVSLPDKMKTFTLLALSANSWIPYNKKNEETTE